MKKLNRGTAPACLARFKHGQDRWDVISKNQLTNDIWKELNIMQQGFCAYCECKLEEDNSKRHIDHFFPKGRLYPQLTFDWSNLFGSCNNETRCGKFKDSNKAPKIELKKVCKPDERDASELMLFLSSGNVQPRDNLKQQDKKMAENTITIFNLNGDSSLINSRKKAIMAEKRLATEYWEFRSQDDNELAKLLEEELRDALNRIKQSEYSTALKQLWQEN